MDISAESTILEKKLGPRVWAIRLYVLSFTGIKRLTSLGHPKLPEGHHVKVI